MSADDPARIEAEIARTRAQLKEAVDELSDRLNPKTQASELTEEAKRAVADLKRRVTGEVRPDDEPEVSRAGWVVLGVGAALAVGLVRAVVRRL